MTNDVNRQACSAVPRGNNSIKAQSPNRQRFFQQALVILVRCSIGLIWASAGPLMPLIMNAYGITRGTASWYAAAAPITIAILAIPVGIIASRYSMKKAFAVGAVLMAGGILAPFAHSFVPLLVTRILFAAGTSIVVPVATAISSDWFTNREMPMVNGVTMSFVNLGNAVAFIATVPLATFIAWQAPIVAYGIYALTVAFLWIIFGKNRTRPVPVNDSGTAKAPVEPFSVRRVLTEKTTVLLGVSVLGMWALGNAMGSWLPSYYHDVFGMTLQKASDFSVIITVGGTLACIAGGILPLRIGRRKPFLIIPGALVGISALSAVLFRNEAMIFVSLAMFGIMGNLSTPTLFTLPVEQPNASPRSATIAISVMQCSGNLGNVIGPLLVGYLFDMTGSYLPGFSIAAVMSLTLLVAGILLPETGHAAKKTAVKIRASQPALRPG